MTEMTREKTLALIYRHTHKDYKGKIGGCGAIMVLRKGGTSLVMMTDLTDAEIASNLPYAIKKEAERKSKMRPVCTCADHDFCLVHPTDTDCLDPNGPWGAP